MKSFLKEFKTFAIRGNAFELAIGVVIGASFQRIVSSLVDSVIMPFGSIFIGGANLRELSFMVGDANIVYGVFFQNILDFLIIAFVIFLVVRTINAVRKKEDSKAAKMPPEDVVLLREIRDLLEKKS